MAGAVAFALTWLLREVPMRETARSDGLGESFASPRDDSSFRELERSLSSLAQHENRWQAYEQFAVRAGLDLSPPELWLLARIDERQPVSIEELRSEFRLDDAQMTSSLTKLGSRALVSTENSRLRLTKAGSDVRERIHTARCIDLNDLLSGWEPEHHAEIQRIVDQLARSLANEAPQPATLSRS